MANLELQFSEVYTKVSEFLGLTSYSTAPTGTDLTRCKDVVYRGYRRFIFPIDMTTKKPHFWSFLRKEGTLITTSSKWKYTLPTDFVCLAEGFRFTNAENSPPLELKSEGFIMDMRSLSTTTAIPRWCAIVNGAFDVETGFIQELKLFPTPNAVLTYYYNYIFNPDKPVNATDLLVGGTIASETILQCCIAAAELQEKPEQLQQGQAGYQETKAQEMLQILIQHDKKLLKNLEDEPDIEMPPMQGAGA